jgi:hypothetical protein
MFLWASYVLEDKTWTKSGVWWPTNLVNGYKRGPECRKKQHLHVVLRKIASKWPRYELSAVSHQRPPLSIMPGRCAGDQRAASGLGVYDTVGRWIRIPLAVGRFDQKLAAPRL